MEKKTLHIYYSIRNCGDGSAAIVNTHYGTNYRDMELKNGQWVIQ